MLDDVSLVAALEWQALQFSARRAFQLVVQASGETADLPEANRVYIYRCAGSLPTAPNMRKRKRASHFGSVSNTGANVVIEDDGIGLDETISFKRPRPARHA